MFNFTRGSTKIWKIENEEIISSRCCQMLSFPDLIEEDCIVHLWTWPSSWPGNPKDTKIHFLQQSDRGGIAIFLNFFTFYNHSFILPFFLKKFLNFLIHSFWSVLAWLYSKNFYAFFFILNLCVPMAVFLFARLFEGQEITITAFCYLSPHCFYQI